MLVTAMVSEPRVRAATNVVELFLQTHSVLQMTPILDSELVTFLHDTLRSCNMSVFSAGSDRDQLRSNTEFRGTVLNPSIPYSANSHWNLTDAKFQ
ncbi:hypothetical protein TNCV_4375591 [Trichonephila clavipes]|uniref:Uncharacterized protein n=1 Tax=Trichonephila clavipes TaxID=2585209 RepID=A0A8X6W1Z5_TRICX|nr:hypothetical protein TNCV_4375591 [Trichonephila clavipes]